MRGPYVRAAIMANEKMLQGHVGPFQRAAEQFIFEVLVRPSVGSEVLGSLKRISPARISHAPQ